MKLGVIANENFRKAVAKLSKQDLPLKTSFKLKNVVKKIHEEFLKYEECRGSALKKFGKKDDSGNLILDDKNQAILEADGMIQFSKELSELAQVDIEIDKINMSDLGESVFLSTDELFLLEPLIQE